MYEGPPDEAAFARIREAAAMPLVYNGPGGQMVGRPFVRSLGERADIMELLARYIAESRAELCGEKLVLGRIKELVAYWRELPGWSRAGASSRFPAPSPNSRSPSKSKNSIFPLDSRG